MFRINAGSIHVFNTSNVLIPPHAFINAEVYDGIPESGLGYRTGFHPLITEFTGRYTVAGPRLQSPEENFVNLLCGSWISRVVISEIHPAKYIGLRRMDSLGIRDQTS